MKYTAYRVFEDNQNQFSAKITELDTKGLLSGELLIRVLYSSLNYKDALSATGNKGVTRSYPHTPGIDAVGIVETSDCDDFVPGQRVIVSGYDLGMNTDGGFGQYIRVPSAWAVNLPSGLTEFEAMIYGTAGLTAALSMKECISSELKPGSAPVLVTGATGGVGSMSVLLLANLGYQVHVVTGKKDRWEWLESLGAKRILSREAFLEDNQRPMLTQQWGGVIDTVGGVYLETALKGVNYGSIVTCCGLVASEKINLTVFPFILRAVSLVGIDSVQINREKREMIWNQLATTWKPQNLALLAKEVNLSEIQPEIDKILNGEQTGRVVINLS